MKLNEEEERILGMLEESVKALRRQAENERAFHHHVLEAAQAVETDIRQFQKVLNNRPITTEQDEDNELRNIYGKDA